MNIDDYERHILLWIDKWIKNSATKRYNTSIANVWSVFKTFPGNSEINYDSFAKTMDSYAQTSDYEVNIPINRMGIRMLDLRLLEIASKSLNDGKNYLYVSQKEKTTISQAIMHSNIEEFLSLSK